MSRRTKKVFNIVIDVLVAIILVLAVILAVSAITSRARGYDNYTEIFGRAYLAVESNSMSKQYSTGEVKEDNFSKGDLIVIRVLDSEEARTLKVGDIITFQQGISDGKYVLNTHRIIEVKGEEGYATSYVTHGDNNPDGANETVLLSSVVGVYQGKSGGIGNVMLFMGTSAGFFTCIVLPTLLVVVYCIANLVLVIRSEKKEQLAAADRQKEDERAKLREELLAEIKAQSQITDGQPQTDGDVGQSVKDESQDKTEKK